MCIKKIFLIRQHNVKKNKQKKQQIPTMLEKLIFNMFTGFVVCDL